jgi:predicted nucleotide-binding protein
MAKKKVRQVGRSKAVRPTGKVLQVAGSKAVRPIGKVRQVARSKTVMPIGKKVTFQRQRPNNGQNEIRPIDSSAKPRVFIGSSSEGVELASALQSQLAETAACTVWNQGLFELGKSTLANLYGFLDGFDFAIFIVTPDDKVDIRGTEFTSTRDNVIFEIGLFMGGIGLDRVIFVSAAKISDFRLPSDLDGITHATYEAGRSDQNISAAVGPAAFKIRQHIKSLSGLHLLSRKGLLRLTYAGAICFRRSNQKIEYLLVTSTQGRTIFPKGRLGRSQQNVGDGARHIALKEAGARGRIVEGVSKHINYFKEEGSAVHRVEVFLLETTQVIKVNAVFRTPTWYSLDEAITKITTDRDYNTSFELARVLEWAEDEIQKYFDRVGTK